MKNYPRTLIYSGLLIFVLLSSCKTTDDAHTIKTINVGGLLSLTGNWSTLGLTSQSAMQIATEEINTYLESTKADYRFATTFYDTKLDAATATQMISDASTKGIQFIIGPQSSAELAAIKSFADAHNMIVVSQGSTAGSLAIAGDNIFRFCPADNVEGPAMANSIYKAGKKGLITVARDDAGNKGLQTATGAAFTALGGTVDAIVPYATTTTDFAPVLATIKSKILSNTALYGASSTAVYYASFDEGAELFKQAAADPVLSSVSWYGGDGATVSTAFTADATAAGFAVATHFFAPTFGLPSHVDAKTLAVEAKIKTATGIEPDAFAMAAYDAMWVFANTMIGAENVSSDFSKIKSTFELKADSYYGATGPTLLNQYGDRSMGAFDYFGIVNEGGTFKWKLVGRSE